MTKNGNKIQKKILKIISKEDKPLSTREFTLKIGVSWHTVQQYCLELLAENKIQRMRVAGAHVWMKKQNKDNDKGNETKENEIKGIETKEDETEKINVLIGKTIDEEIELLKQQLEEAMKKKQEEAEKEVVL